MKKLGIDYWLIAGSLLGACRNGSIIPHDDDIDIAMNVTHMPKLMDLQGVTPLTDRNKDWIPVYETDRDVLRISPRWQTLVHEKDPRYWVDGKFVDKEHGLWVDIFAYHELPGNVYARKYPLNGLVPRFPGEQLFPLRDTELEGVAVKIPRQAEIILESKYGKNFSTPDHVLRHGQWVKTGTIAPGIIG